MPAFAGALAQALGAQSSMSVCLRFLEVKYSAACMEYLGFRLRASLQNPELPPMALLENLPLNLGPALARTVLKLWLPEKPLTLAATDGVIDILKKRGEAFATVDATDRLFRNLASEIAVRLQRTIDIEFQSLPESDRDAAVLAVAEVFRRLDLSSDLMRANLNALGLEQLAKPQAQTLFNSLGGDAKALAELILRETAAYAVTLAGKLPDFQVAATRELLKRTSELVHGFHGTNHLGRIQFSCRDL